MNRLFNQKCITARRAVLQVCHFGAMTVRGETARRAVLQLKLLFIFMLFVTSISLHSFDLDSLAVLDHEETTHVQPISTSFGLMMLQMIGMLVLITILLYFLLSAVKKLNRKYKTKNQLLSFNILENIYFSQKQGVSAVSFANKLYLIGFSINAVNLIDKIEDPEIIAQINPISSAGACLRAGENPQYAKTKQFPEIFTKFFSKDKVES